MAEPPIVQALEAIGAKVYRHLPVDLLVFHRGRFMCLEVKTPKIGRIFASQSAQREFLMQTGTPLVKTPEEALKAVLGA